MRNYLLFTIALSLIGISCNKSIKSIIEETNAATFVIYTFDEYGAPSGEGSGFFVDERGTGVTNYHVLDKSVKAFLKTADGQQYEINEVIASDAQWDIVKFSVKNPNGTKFSFLEFANKAPEQGDKIYNISSPLGLEHTVSDGIASSLRQDKHGDIVQVTTPVSPGSSGSALLNDQGKVVAVATFIRTGGQNINFGVLIDEQKLAALLKNPFVVDNPKFNKKDNFILLNIPSDRDQNIVLNALEFTKEATVAYLSFTNLEMSMDQIYIWCSLNEGDDGFLIHDKDRSQKYYVTSSTIGANKENGTEIKIATSHKFKVFFPPIREELHRIDVVDGYSSRGWQFSNIDLDKYRSETQFDTDNYIKEYAYSTMREGNTEEAMSIFVSVLEEKPTDFHALNALGLISYILDNNKDAELYFTRVIENHPASTIGYLNRSKVYKYQKRYTEALNDMNRVIEIDNAQPDNYFLRAILYLTVENPQAAKNDMDIVIESEDFKHDAMSYYYRAYCNMLLGQKREARKDIEMSYRLTNDKELESELISMWQNL